MAVVRKDDLIASVNKYLDDNWPDSTVKRMPPGWSVIDGFSGTEPDKWVAQQWIAVGRHRETRKAEAEVDWDLRLICYSRAEGELMLASTGIADGLEEILSDGTRFDLISYADGSTAIGHVRVSDVSVVPEDRDARNVRYSILDVTGWARVPT